MKYQKRIGLMASHAKWRAYTTGVAVFAAAFLITFLAASVFTPFHNTNAEGTNDDQSSAGGYSLSLSTTASIDLNLTVGPIDVMTVGQGTVNVATTSTNGYKLYIGMKTNSTSLTKSGTSDTIAGTTGTITAPQSLTRGTWGYAIPSNTAHLAANGFSSSYTTMTSSMPDPSYRFATPPANNSNPTLIATNTTATAGDTYPIYYGVRANKDTAEGAYSNNVLFTAVADAGSTEGVTLTPATVAANTATAITVTTTLYSTADSLDANVYFLTSAQYNSISGTNVEALGISPLTCTKTSSTPLTYSCTIPATSTIGNYYIYVKAPRYDKVYSTTLEVTKDFWGITYMQEMTSQICASAPTPAVTATNASKVDTDGSHRTDNSYVPQRTLTDIRDGEQYRVRKLADGNCWMTENLRLQNRSISNANSNLPANKTVNIPASSTASWCATDSSECDNQLMISNANDGSHPEYGVFYNWYTATATYGTFNTVGSVSYDICSKGWRLPNGGEFASLRNNYYSSSTFGDNWTLFPLNLVLSGRRYGINYDQGGAGFYWTNSSFNNSGAYRAELTSSIVTPLNGGYKYGGLTIRCVAK